MYFPPRIPPGPRQTKPKPPPRVGTAGYSLADFLGAVSSKTKQGSGLFHLVGSHLFVNKTKIKTKNPPRVGTAGETLDILKISFLTLLKDSC